MSTATFNTPTMQNAAPSSATVWRHLLWKDIRQVWQLIIGIAVIQACLQLMLGFLETVFPSDMQRLSSNAINIALASPTLLAIAISGVLMGQERQTGCWTWSSSLPVSWRQSFASKVLVWLGASLATTTVLLAVSAIVLAMNHTSLGRELLSNETGMTYWTQVMTLVIGVQVFIYLSIATLLIKDTLMAIAIAAFGLLAFHLQVVIFNLINISNALSGRGNYQNYEITILCEHFVASVIGAIWLAATYRWRWGVGQYSSISIFRGAAHSNTRLQRTAWNSFAATVTQPSELRMLLTHGLRSSFWLRATVFCGTMFLIFASRHSPWAALLASCILGVSVFSGEQTSNRYRYFADRGVDWKKLLATHIALPALLTLVLVLCAANLNLPDQDKAGFYAACFSAFAVAMYSSLVFPSPIVSVTAALAVWIGAFAFTGYTFSIWFLIAPGHWLAIAIWIPISILLVLGATFVQVPYWLIKDRPNATWLYFGIVLIADLSPCVLGLSFGFLQIPKVAWQGTPINQIKPVDWNGGPDLKAWNGSIFFDQASLLRSVNLPNSLHGSRLSSVIQEQIPNHVRDFPSWFSDEKMANLLKAIETGGPKPENFDYQASVTLCKMIEGSAILALMATQERQKELAIRAWQANRKLIAFCHQPALQPATMRSVSYVWEIWNTMQEDDLRFLLDTNELPELTPTPQPSREQFQDVLRARATIHRMLAAPSSFTDASFYRSFYYRSFPTDWSGYSAFDFYPPIRWAGERQHALTLNEDLKLEDLPSDVNRFGTYRDRIVHEYSVLSFLEAEFDQRLRLQQKSPESENVSVPESSQ